MTKPRLIVLASVAGLFVWLFADALVGSGMFVFRDAGHYYYPLFEFVAKEWSAGRVPLWNPYENLGVPLAGNATSSVFYPGKLIFALPLDYAWAYKLYVMGHVLLAAWAAFRLARHWNASVGAAGVAALSYAFSGNVLYQYCNVVFLISAAWLPVAMLAADRMLGERSGFRGQGAGGRGQRQSPRVASRGSNMVRVQGSGFRGQGRVRWAVAFGTVLALMVLGGDPQTAYHAGLLAAMYAVWLWWHKRRQTGGDEQASAQSKTWPARLAGSHFVLLAVAALTGLVLSAVQVFPSVEFTRHSSRVAGPVARTVYEIPGHLFRRQPADEKTDGHWADGLLSRRLESGMHHEHVYHFSVGPWRLAEYVWPNFSGRQFPVHRRWLNVIPAEGRIWVPSFYMGLIPLVLALAAMRLRHGDARTSWLSWAVVLSVLASFGWYGLGWLVYEIRAAAGGDVSNAWLVGPPFGGVYWLLTVLLPGYVYFRYPAKLLVVAALGLSMLAAAGWDRAFASPSVRLRRWVLGLGGASLAGAVLAVAVRPFWHEWLGGVDADGLFGPLETDGAANDLLFAFLQTAVVCGLFWWLLKRANGGSRWAQAAGVVLVAVDLAVANGWMVACAPADQWREEPKLAAVLKREEARSGDGQPYRVFRRPVWMPPSWKEAASDTRLAEAMQWDRDTLWPKYNLAAGIPLAEVHGTMMPYDYQVFLWDVKRRGSGLIADPSGLGAVNVKYAILRGEDVLKRGQAPFSSQTGSRAPNHQQTKKVPVPFFAPFFALEDVSLWGNPGHMPRAWIVHGVDVVPPLDSDCLNVVLRRTEEVFYPRGRPRDLRESAVVESEQRMVAEETDSRPDDESCRVIHYDPLRVEIEAELAQPGLVLLCDQFYPGWRLDVQTAGGPSRRVPILRTNRVMRGAWLPAASHRLVYRYRPASFLLGAVISGAAWIGLGIMGIAITVARRSGRAGQKGSSLR